jgi:hypothetical protein
VNRSQARRLTVPSLFAVAALAACVVDLNFSYTQSGLVVDTATAGNAIDTTVPVDLSGQSDISSHLGNIQSLTLNTMDITIVSVQSDNTAATVAGNVYLRADAATDAAGDVLVGTIGSPTPFAISANATAHFTGNPALDAFVLATAKGSRKFKVVIKGTTTGGTKAHFTVNVAVAMSLGYGT